MKKVARYLLLIFYIFGSIITFYLVGFIFFQPDWSEIFIDWSFYVVVFLYFITIQEFVHWAKIGRRSEMSDLVAIAFFFFLIFFFTKDLLTSLMGAFSIYLWFGIFELKDYPILNKILVISLVTYNVIFIAGLFSAYLNNPFYLNTAFAFSFWIILGLGFILFGRKYIIVWRFMSPAYLTLFLYIIAWLAVIFINQYTLIDFSIHTPFGPFEVQLIYPVLIIVNWIVYFISGPILDKLLGIKRVDDEELLNLVENVKNDIGIKGKVKVGFGKYPILNALAYGSFFDKRIAVIAESKDQIPEDELKGIVAHELSHTKGNHTLILTFIATIDLFIRMILDLPATYYDYTFGNPKIPMIYFILLNIVIYMFIYIFVRILEGNADLYAKKSGYAKELAKALYNLESFYATGREFGLNTMLLCDEKITRENQILDYIKTAEYLYSSMIKPSRGSLLANFMNSHPPSYFRIAAILSDELKPGKEALLPFICLKRSKQIKYAMKFEKARKAFKIIANEKFKELFEINNISKIIERLERKTLYKYELNNEFIFKNLITEELIIGRLDDIQFLDEVCDADQYIITNLKTNQKEYLNASIFSKIRIKFGERYYFKNTPFILNDILLNEDKKGGNYLFLAEGKKILKPIRKTKLPNSDEIIKSFEDMDVFLKMKGKLKVFKCINVKLAKILDDYEIELKNSLDESSIKYYLKDLIIRPKTIYLSISNNLDFRNSEIDLINWMIKNQVFSYIYLKKPVNNLEIGYIQLVNVNRSNLKKNVNNEEIETQNSIIVKNIFGKEKTIEYNSLELITFDYNTAMMQLKSETSMFSRLGYKILHKFKPRSIFYVNKL
ncbi:MAG: M48 family metalloprotease [Promethearchaeota archaeon]